MLPRRIVPATPLRRAALAAARRTLLPAVQQRTFIPESINGRRVIDEKYPEPPRLTEAEDPLMNGGFVQPAPVKRQFRDPHGDWWDKQERRNYNEPVHEDYDQLGMFTPYEYTWTTTGKGLAQIGAFLAVFLAVVYTVKETYPDRVTVPRTFEGGLERELGGSGALRARSPEDEAAEEV
ncbi:NADH dehydrogenase (ubiquinone) 1 beta subcomplex 8 [Sporothrix brasiliensis 5110]|uniref:NADH dehydrogenase (Ubiquinone) 1 beta subcomplex 8 n=1 Tax=Sporothrix brasiliensis 5110 TaxID=1398154 RepID=A0A0C2FSN9_9PEZI|nr:NADH dehydrogenase (ubiquinone) 1 beta subcomplex 8 [Sporothrix brasiliensis 5110]KIH94038.1 NADH dehydrogenase (ubiquinone) 1 beta subcomplex 8 [Sporothrix brasiliensis 5110]